MNDKRDISRFGSEVLVRWLEDKGVFGGRTFEYILRSDGITECIRYARCAASDFIYNESQRIYFEAHLQKCIDTCLKSMSKDDRVLYEKIHAVRLIEGRMPPELPRGL